MYQGAISGKLKSSADSAIKAMQNNYRRSFAALSAVGVVGMSSMGYMYVNDNQLKVGLVPTGNIISVNSVEGQIDGVKAERTIQVVDTPENNEAIAIASCLVKFQNGSSDGDNTTFIEDNDCSDGSALFSTYTVSSPGVLKTPVQISNNLDSLTGLYDIEHENIEIIPDSPTTTIFRTFGTEKFTSDIYFREGATSETVITSSLVGVSNGVAELDTNGKVPTSQMPSIAITETYTVANESELLSLEAQEGDVAIRTDLEQSFIHLTGTGQTLSDWTLLKSPTDTVLSVNGEQGVVALDTDDVPEGISSKYYTEGRVSANGDVTANTAHRTSHSSTSDVTFNSVSTTSDIKAGGYIEFKMLADHVATDCDNDLELSRMYFNTTYLRPYVCSKNGSEYVWKPLDSDFDKDGVIEDTDVDDTNAEVAVCLKGYYWSEMDGWISLGSGDSNSDGKDDSLTGLDYCDPNSGSSTAYAGADGLIKGYAYSENSGYINFDSVNSTSSIW